MKPLGVGILTLPKSGDFFLGAVKHPLAALEDEAVIHETKMKPCQHPEAHLALHAPFSVLELLKFDSLKVSNAVKHPFLWMVAHWNTDLHRTKIHIFETFHFFAKTTEDEVFQEWKKISDIWSKDGYFAKKEWDEKQSQAARRVLARGIVKKGAEKRQALTLLATAQFSVLSQSFKHTVAAKLRGDESAAINYYEAESSLPVSNPDIIDYAIVKAYSRPGNAPYDKEIAAEIRATTGMKASEETVKKRRNALGVSRNTHGPRPNV